MKTRLLLAAALILLQGCKPARQTPVAPPPVVSVPSAVSNSPAGTTLSADERSLQTLRDLGVTPEVMLQLVRSQLAAASTSPAPDSQPPPMAVADPSPVATAPDATPPVEQALEPAPVPVGEPVPVEDLPASTDPAQPMVIVVTNTVVIREVHDFQAPLDSYGTWVEMPTYGRVWQPAVTVVDVNWRPYNQCGRWIFTDCGWYWESDYSWGWAAFHYGRWCYVRGYRWIWVPDTVWGPAWVSWRRSETHCGWAALPPGTPFQEGTGFTLAHDDDFDTHCGLSPRHYSFVPTERFCDRNLLQAIVDNLRVEELYRGSTHIRSSHVRDSRDRRVHNAGPDRKGSREIARPTPARPRVVTGPHAGGNAEKPRRTSGRAAQSLATDKPEKPHRAEPVREEPVVQVVPVHEDKPDKPEKPHRAEPVREEPVVQVVPVHEDKPDKPEKPHRAEPVREEPVVQVVPVHEDKPDKPEKPHRAEPVREEPVVQVSPVHEDKPDKPEKPQRTEPVREEDQSQIVPAHDVKPDRAEKSSQPKPAVVSKQGRTFEAPERTSRQLDVHKQVTTAAGPGGLDTSSATLHREAAPSTKFVSPEGLWTPAPVDVTRASTRAEPRPVKRVVSPVEVRQDVPSLHIDAAAAPQAPRLNAATIRATAPPPAVKQAARAEAAVPSALQRTDVSAAATPAVKKADKVEKSDKNDKSSGRSGSDKKHADDSDDPR